MPKLKKMPRVVLQNISNARSANATLTIIKSDEFLPIEGRRNEVDQKFANIIGLDGTFTEEYFSKNKDGKNILKSDKKKSLGNLYIEVGKNPKENPHHRIDNDVEINKRLTSIVKARKRSF